MERATHTSIHDSSGMASDVSGNKGRAARVVWFSKRDATEATDVDVRPRWTRAATRNRGVIPG
jgi:hypothetical protein